MDTRVGEKESDLGGSFTWVAMAKLQREGRRGGEWADLHRSSWSILVFFPSLP